MSDALDALGAIAPALAFLLAAVPFARLLGALGFFDAVVARWAEGGRPLPLGAFWALSAATTAVLNLDTTVVLLTPLAVRLARRAGVDPLPVAAVPLLLAGLASSFLPVSNLTTLIVADRLDVGAVEVLRHLGPASTAAVLVGWLVHRRRAPRRLDVGDAGAVDVRALRIGGAVVVGLLAWFTVGEALGLAPWVGLVLADLVLAAVLRTAPWQGLPWVTAAAVAVVAAVVGVVAPRGVGGERFWSPDGPEARLGVLAAAVVVANVVNNLPATLLAVAPDAVMTDGRWLWLLGVNVGSLLLPTGTLAAVLWWRLVADHGVAIDLRRYLRVIAPPALGGTVAAAAVALVTFGA